MLLARNVVSTFALLSASLSASDGGGVSGPNQSVRSIEEQSSTETPWETVVIPDVARGVGARKAGLMCLPNGRFEVRDFLASDRQFEGAILIAFLNRGISRPQDHFSYIALSGINVSLCARNYLPGKSKLFSGSATFTFVVGNPQGDRRVETVELLIDRKGAKSEDDIVATALTELVSRILNGQ